MSILTTFTILNGYLLYFNEDISMSYDAFGQWNKVYIYCLSVVVQFRPSCIFCNPRHNTWSYTST